MGYQMRHRIGALAGVAQEPIFLIWNPHASISVKLTSLGYQINAAASAEVALFAQRAFLRGTPTSTATATAAHDDEGASAPASGLVIDEIDSAAPPTISGTMFVWTLPLSASSALVIPFPRGLWLPPSQGLSVRTAQSPTLATSDVTVSWEE